MAKVVWDDNEIAKRLNGIPNRMNAFIYASCRYHSRRAQTYAKQNAKWRDRTSNARNGLGSKVIKGSNKTAIVVYGTVTYQPWLEIRFSGRYAIIGPTIRKTGPELMQTLSKGYDTIFGGKG